MPAVIICTEPDGRILVSGMAQAPEEYKQGAVEVASLEEATRMAADVLGEGESPQHEAGEGTEESGAEEASERSNTGAADGTRPSGDADMSPMQAGFKRARKGY